MVNYWLILFVYSPILLLLFINTLKDRFEVKNLALRECDWSLRPATIALFILLSGEVIRSLWYSDRLPLFHGYQFNLANQQIFSLIYHLVLLVLIYVFLRHVQKKHISQVFDLKLSQLSVALKICALLAVINGVCIYIFNVNIIVHPQKLVLDYINSSSIKQIISYMFISIVLTPLLEESLYRGLIYSPLYRKVGRRNAMILSSLIWTQGHFEALAPSIGVFFVGIFLTWLYDKSGSLVHPLVLHIFMNSWLLIYTVSSSHGM